MKFKTAMALLFSGLFIAVSVSLAGLATYQFIANLLGSSQEELIAGCIRSLNTAFISLATFELGVSIGKEYSGDEEEDNIYAAVRRTITRFVSVVSIALVLEGLIMVIKYSQLDLAGNLFYPVAIIASAALLLMAQGVFIHLTRRDCEPLACGDTLQGTNQSVTATSPSPSPAESLAM